MKLFATLYRDDRTVEIYENGKGTCAVFYDTDFLGEGTRNNEERQYDNETTVYEAMYEAKIFGWKEWY